MIVGSSKAISLVLVLVCFLEIVSSSYPVSEQKARYWCCLLKTIKSG